MSYLSNLINNVLQSMGVFAPILACFLISIESILPILPLCVFITVNFIAFGSFWGFIISWFFTILGCMLSFFLTRKVGYKKINKMIKKSNRLNEWMKYLNKTSLQTITVILAIPFTPAFAVNIAAGLTDIKPTKYLMSLIIGKIFLVYFWGFVGTSLIESLTNPYSLIKVLIMIVLAYILSKIASKIFKIEY